jgi:hypothetical protein
VPNTAFKASIDFIEFFAIPRGKSRSYDVRRWATMQESALVCTASTRFCNDFNDIAFFGVGSYLIEIIEDFLAQSPRDLNRRNEQGTIKCGPPRPNVARPVNEARYGLRLGATNGLVSRLSRLFLSKHDSRRSSAIELPSNGT